jgi:hypothetical protein
VGKNKLYARKSKENQQKQLNLWFVATLILCLVVLVLSAFVYYVIIPSKQKIGINAFLDENGSSKASHLVCIEEDMTLAEIADRTDLTYDQLYEVMNIPEGTDPQTTLAELFDTYKAEAEDLDQ